MSKLFDEEFLQKFSRLKFIVRKVLAAGTTGEKTIRQKGGRIEFSDYRKYSPGDEAQRIDWNVFGRTEKLFIKEFAREESLPVYILLDLTASMAAPRRSKKTPARDEKFTYACQLAAALGYIGLVTDNPLRIFGFSGQLLKTSTEFRGESQALDVLKFLESLDARGETDLSVALNSLNKQIRAKGLLILISDLMESRADGERGILAGEYLLKFVQRGFVVSVFHLLTRAEENPVLTGWVKLKDAEIGATRTVLVDEKKRTEYLQTLNKFIEEWQSFCAKHNIKYFHVNTDLALETLLLNFLRQGGLLK